jgi:DNA modification methylase
MHDNRTAELAEWDVQQLTADRDAGLDLSPFFSDVELAHVLGVVLTTGRTDPDAVPDLRPTSVSPGDLFALGDHRLLCGDSTDPATVARLFADRDRAGMCFTSPPYADQRQYTGDAPDLAPERLARFLPSAAPFVDLFAVNLGIVRRSGFLVRYWDTYIAAAEAVGLGLLSWNVWSREGKQMSVGQLNAMFPIQHEWIFVFGRERQRLVPTVANKTGGRTSTIHDRDATGAMTRGVPIIKRPRRELGTVTTIPPVRSNGDHPAQFPIGLPLAYLSSVVGPVFDPFSGAGTTIIAAEQLARPCSAIEIAPRYIQVAIDRWEAFTGQAAEKLGTIVPE